MKLKRWLALDCFKTLAIFGMIAWHLSIWWFNLNPEIEKGVIALGIPSWPYLVQAIVGVSANFSMSIPVVAGASLKLYLDKRSGKSSSKNILLGSIAKKAFALAVLGFAMNLLAFGASYWHLWNVLQLISLSMLVISALALYSSLYVVAISGLLVIFAAPLLRASLQGVDSYFAFMLVGDKIGDYIWSFFPWYGIIVYGFMIAHLYFYFKKKNHGSRFRLFLVAASLLVVIVAIFNGSFFYSIDLEYPWGYLFFQPRILTVLSQLSVFNITLVLLDLMFSEKAKIGKFNIINVFSRGILWIYVMQMIVGFRLVEFLVNSGYRSIPILSFVMALIYSLSYAVGTASILIKEKMH